MPISTRDPFAALMILVLVPALAAADEKSGVEIYRQKCLSCHGESGTGTEDYPRPLTGDRSVAQLSKLIAKTMPEDDPGTCVGEDADKVAAYIHDAFYSTLAQARIKPARIELSRLTVRQYRNAVTDLVGSFRPAPAIEPGRGLKASYYKSREPNEGQKAFERIDPMVKFDFGESSPDPAKLEANRFSVLWTGSILAPETGEYEFCVTTEHATKLWINDSRTPLIDAQVKSGDDTEHRATIALLGGRQYHIRLDLSKAKQGVDDEKKKNPKRKPKGVKASISLEWKPPQQVGSPIPERNLTPARSPEVFVLTSPFPPDDRSVGYERGTSVSKAWDTATTDAAIEAAGYVATHLRDLAGTKDDAPDRDAKLKEFCHKFAERAFRRPLDDEQKAFFIDRQFAEARDAETAVKRVVILTLKSPRFLYREIGGSAPGPYEVASRISFGLWDSLPDQPLLEAAAKDELKTREQVAQQAERMMNDPRTHTKLREFFLQWLKVERGPEIAKDPDLFPGFDPAIVSDMRTSLEIFLDEVIWGSSSDFRQLLLADYVYLNGRLASFFGAEVMPDAPFQRVAMDPNERSGVLTHPYMLSSFAYTATSSPIHRGVFLSRSVLGRGLKPPPIAVSPLAPDLHASLTTRERVTLQTSPAACMTCHGMINPLGFGLERFDAVGRYRSQEQGKPIDATGTLETRDGGSEPFSGARELAQKLSASEETHTALVAQLFHHTVKQPIRAYGEQTLPDLRKRFVDNQFHVRKLLVEILASSALADPRQVPEKTDATATVTPANTNNPLSP